MGKDEWPKCIQSTGIKICSLRTIVHEGTYFQFLYYYFVILLKHNCPASC